MLRKGRIWSLVLYYEDTDLAKHDDSIRELYRM